MQKSVHLQCILKLYNKMAKKFQKSATNKKIAGVCGGLGAYFNIDPAIIRLIFVLLVIFAGTGILAYIILALVMSSAK